MDTTTILLLMLTCLCSVNCALRAEYFPDFARGIFSIAGTNYPCTGLSNEQRCFDELNTCIHRLYWCDTIIDCPNAFDENPLFCRTDWKKECSNQDKKPFSTVYCDNGMCITECDVCDGHFLDCTDGSDENPALCRSDSSPTIEGDCSSYRQQFNPQNIK